MVYFVSDVQRLAMALATMLLLLSNEHPISPSEFLLSEAILARSADISDGGGGPRLQRDTSFLPANRDSRSCGKPTDLNLLRLPSLARFSAASRLSLVGLSLRLVGDGDSWNSH